MKVCPSCQSSYPDGFKYCPQDNNTLVTGEEYARQQQAAMKPAPVVPAPDLNTVTHQQQIAEEIVVPKPEAQMESATAKSVQHTADTVSDATPAAPYIAPRDIDFQAKSQPVPSAPAAPVPTETTVAKDNAKTKSNAANGSANKAAAASVGASWQPAPNADLNFTLPDNDGLLTRLFGSLRNIQDVKFSLNPQQWLVTRVFREFGFTLSEFAKDPKKFVLDLAKGEGTNARRRNLLLAGSEMGAVGYVTMYLSGQAVGLLGKGKPATFNAICLAFVTYLVGCFIARGFLLSRIVNKFSSFITLPKLGLEVATWGPLVGLLFFIWSTPVWFCAVFPSQCLEGKKDELYKLEMLANVTTEKPPEVKTVVEKPKPLGGSKPKPAPAGGGGGGNMSTPVSKGVPPQMSMVPQVMPPTVRTPTIKNPSLVVPTTTLGDDALSKRQAGPIGLADGADAPPSVGNGGGTGIGSGNGAGQGPGRGMNRGGGDPAIGGGTGEGGIFAATGSLKPNVFFKTKAKYTEEARQNRVTGTVVLQAVFTADGRITNVRVVRGLPDGLNEEAIKALQQFKFTPAMKNGQPVSVRMSLEFAFNLL